ncbi:MAG: ATP-binding protein, partial [Methanocorpusculum sp.]|nr:ATP-binding protein [Methanocorpusculum sp.]
MGRIQILDEETINHIAAGEVIERAASVVKELVENAVDADAKKIIIDITADASAVTRISVTDDGIGVSAEDAVLAFRQHATSKISRPDDLAGIVTLGFRGEALASIAAVSKVTFTSKERGSSAPEAAQVVIHGGALIRQSFVGAPEGTTITVEDLFYNTPARRKFQRKVTTELSHMYDMVERIALAHRNVSFVLLYQG